MTAIGNSTYWRQVSKTVTLYGGASESITVDGNTLVTTNSDGSVTTSVPYGTHTYKGSVSGQSFSKTVTKYTTDVKVMPEGLVIYWYGYKGDLFEECLSAYGWSYSSSSVSSMATSLKYYTNYIDLGGVENKVYSFSTNRKIRTSEFTKSKIIAKGISHINNRYGLIYYPTQKQYYTDNVTSGTTCDINSSSLNTYEKEIQDDSYVVVESYSTRRMYVYALWLE